MKQMKQMKQMRTKTRTDVDRDQITSVLTYLTQGTVNDLDQLAKETRTNRDELIQQAVEEYLEYHLPPHT